ncbi:hypothetical protein BJV82DRAFT_675403 [Fennellomyces sp. T-0311]|nr:hypothetical protein BJV82DRAFT_675403 [Fennellomyces sp. T-0311]
MSCMLSFFKRIYSAAKSCFTNSTDDPCSDLRNESSSQPSSSSQRIDGSETLCLNVSHTIQRNEHAMYRPREHVKRVILNSLQDEKDLFYLMRRLYVWQRNNITSLELDGCTITDPDTFLDTLALISPGSLKYLRIVNHTSNSAFPHTFTVCSQLTHFTYHVNSYNLTRNDKGNELDWETPLLVNELVPRTTPLRVDNSQVVTHCPNSMELIGFLEFLQRQQLHTLDWCDINLRDANSMVTVLNNYPGLNTLILRMDLTLDHSSCTALHSMHHLQALHLSHITLNYDLSLVTLLESFPALEDLMLCDLTLSDAIPKGSKDPERLRQIDLDNIKWNNACTDDAVTRLLRKCAKHSNLQVVSLCNLKGFTTQALERIAAISTLKSVEVELIEERNSITEQVLSR